MKTATYITDYVLLKADTNSDFDTCHFAVIHCTKEWRERMQQRLNALQTVESEMGFVSLKFYDTSVDFYRIDENEQPDIQALLGGKDWAFVELEENEQDTFLVPESRLDCYRLSLYQYGTAIYTAYGKHSGDEFFTTEFSVPDILNYHQQTIQIVQLY